MPSEPIRVIVVIVVHPREVLPFSLGQDFAHPTLASLVDRNQTLDDHHVTPNAVELRMPLVDADLAKPVTGTQRA